MSEWKKRRKPKEDELVLLLCERKLKDSTGEEVKQRAVCVGMYCKLLSDREAEYCERVNNDFDEYLIPLYDKVIGWMPLPSMEV